MSPLSQQTFRLVASPQPETAVVQPACHLPLTFDDDGHCTNQPVMQAITQFFTAGPDRQDKTTVVTIFMNAHRGGYQAVLNALIEDFEQPGLQFEVSDDVIEELSVRQVYLTTEPVRMVDPALAGTVGPVLDDFLPLDIVRSVIIPFAADDSFVANQVAGHRGAGRREMIRSALPSDFPGVVTNTVLSYAADIDLSQENTEVILAILKSRDPGEISTIFRRACQEGRTRFLSHLLYRITSLIEDPEILDFSSVDFRHLHLYSLCMPGVSLNGARLDNSVMINCYWPYANLTGAVLDNAVFRSTSLNGALLTDASAVRANMTGVNLSNATLTRTNFQFATLDGSDLSWSRMLDTDFCQASMHGTIMVAVPTLSSARFDGVRSDHIHTDDDTELLLPAELRGEGTKLTRVALLQY